MAGAAEFLAEHGIPGTGTGQLAADGLLGRLVRISDRRQVRLGLDVEVQRLEAAHGLVIHGIGQHMGQAQVIVVARSGLDHGSKLPSNGGVVGEVELPWR